MVSAEVCFPLLPALSYAGVPPSRPCPVSTPRSCASCGTSPEGEGDPTCTRAGETGPIPASPGSDPATEPEDELPGPPPEWVECYGTRDRADAALMAQYLENWGITAQLIREPRVLGGQAMIEVGGVLIRPKDLPLARRLIERIARRRARRQRPAEYPWDVFVLVGLPALAFCTLMGYGFGTMIGGVTGWEHLCPVVGGGFGFILGLSLIIWMCRAR